MPTSSASVGEVDRIVPFGRMIMRASFRRCPLCGDRRAWFTGWFRQGDACVRCGLRRTRGVEGHELGALTIAIVVNVSLVVLAVGVSVALTLPDVPVLRLYVVLASAAVLIPVATWPLTHTVWMAIDLRLRPLAPDESGDPSVR